MKSREFFTYSSEETIELGKKLANEIPKGQVIAFFGDLAAGKTTLVKGLATALSGVCQEEINSPTFIYLNIYNGPTTVYHFDLYRLSEPSEFFAMGFDEHFDQGGVCLLEWAERIEESLPPNTLKIRMQHLQENGRRIFIEQ